MDESYGRKPIIEYSERAFPHPDQTPEHQVWHPVWKAWVDERHYEDRRWEHDIRFDAR
jgi:hypothetical protein